MGFFDALGHLFNLFLPALGVAALAALLAKALWRRELKGVPLQRLAAHAAVAGVVATLAGLIVTGRDGRIGSYFALVLANALGLWWAAFGPGRR
ncbi:conserved hypothetical protein [Leptothrix cholodnii SP-6]|uniref:Transmembrane protein n=1 Tax=Leptothrix cholodnii (strain ATCC 51168 / LMG 8142 / SP-6) TaxID=395495 RepID=B1XYX3_LEPCP|nr:hypothetical protein [Leptothrix cholodnii]ACB32857.1 conserved hypothetical protein [Leptothrix cholodnii SP-6]